VNKTLRNSEEEDGRAVVIFGKYTISCSGGPELGLKSAIVRIEVGYRKNVGVLVITWRALR
jgi:hypothetical protein